jgi:hypothetical protein
MKKIIKILPVLIVACACMSGCTTIWEDVWIEHIPPSVIEIDTITVPPWDERESFMLNEKKTPEYETDKESLRDNSMDGNDNAACLSRSNFLDSNTGYPDNLAKRQKNTEKEGEKTYKMTYHDYLLLLNFRRPVLA